MAAVEFFLPMLPPSKNKLRQRGVVGKKIPRTKEYEAWRKAAGQELMIQRIRQIKGRYRLLISATEPNDNRHRDLGNLLEATEDLLTWMRVIEDDHLSRRIELEWVSGAPGVVIRVESVPE